MSSSHWTKPVLASSIPAAEYSTRWPRRSLQSPGQSPGQPSGFSGSHAAPVQDGYAQLSLLPLFPSAASVVSDEVERLRQELLPHIRASRRGRGAQLELAITNNRSTMISVRRGPGRYQLRLHRMFLIAGATTLSALGRYITDNDRQASAELGEFIEAHQAQFPSRPRPPLRMQSIISQGKHYNLQEMFDRLNCRYFSGAIDARITWGRLPRCSRRPRRHRSLKLGSYSVEDRLIRIHPTLDQPYVPSFFVEWIVYHEMLHQKHPIPVIGGRRRYHTPAFMAEERLFDDYERARQWERRHLHRLLVF